ncbi:Sensor histidine kinase RcsC [Aquimixticola soesokkakensis]|uniref:Sensor histidine kinase RcsC n=1 Tax=Aquimixticola soesokkakensis TaxID=1519096 RepID=A0A1Y5T3Y7_9RHOB|nr:response regulator [Aquimixticola soesokkakensis]SLN55283.1 Sensor histidine kinase RcsC [Aquimixticola soesokkakensis]
MKSHILIVEDDPTSRFLMSEMLDDLGVGCEEVPNGQACLETLSQNSGRFDAIFMDIHMPVMTGDHATREIRRAHDDPPRNLTVFAVTADTFWHDSQVASAAGFNGVISKPITRAKIATVLESLRAT